MASGNSGIIFSYIPLLLSKESIRSEREGLKMEVMVELAMLYSERHVSLCHINHIVALKALHTSVKHSDGIMQTDAVREEEEDFKYGRPSSGHRLSSMMAG